MRYQLGLIAEDGEYPLGFVDMELDDVKVHADRLARESGHTGNDWFIDVSRYDTHETVYTAYPPEA